MSYSFVPLDYHSISVPPQQQGNSADNSRIRDEYTVSTGAEFRLTSFASTRNFRAACQRLQCFGGSGAGPNGIKLKGMSNSEIMEMCRSLAEAVRDRVYRPYPARLVRIPKSNGGYRELSVHDIADRMVSRALLTCIHRILSPTLPGIGRSTHRLFARMQQVMREQRRFVLAVDDIRNCFPSAPIDPIMELLRQHLSRPVPNIPDDMQAQNQQDLAFLFESIIRGHEGPEHLIGLEQGSPLSPIAMELFLHHRFDSELDAQDQTPTHLLRYVDNLTFVCRSVSEGIEVLERSRDILSESGLTLKGEDGEPQDIRDPQYGNSILGFKPAWRDGRLTLSIQDGNYLNLETVLQDVWKYPKPLIAARAIIRGWTQAIGPAITRSSALTVVNRILRIVGSLGLSEIDREELTQFVDQALSLWVKTQEQHR